jgi:tetratricopeptide (TPR) repeat protein
MFRVLRSVGVGLLMLVLAGVGTSWAQNGGLTGHATLQDGSVCVKCPVIIERTDIKATYQTKTDKKGNYIYIGLSPDSYKVTLQDPNGKTLFWITTHVGMGEPTQVDFNLAKELANQQKASPQAAQQAAEQQKENQQFNSLKEVFNQGVALEDQKQYAQAAEMFQKAEPMAKGKNLAAVMEREAGAYHQAKMYDQAVAIYQKLIAADPAASNYHFGLGSTYADAGKSTEALAECAKDAQMNPSEGARCYFNIGAVANNTGKMDDAADAFKKATEADPKNEDAYFLEGQALMGKATVGSDGKIVPAPGTVEALQTYLQLDAENVKAGKPKGQYVDSATAMIQSVQGSVTTDVKSRKKKGT